MYLYVPDAVSVMFCHTASGRIVAGGACVIALSRSYRHFQPVHLSGKACLKACLKALPGKQSVAEPAGGQLSQR